MISLGSLGSGVRYAFTSRAGGFSEPPYDTLNLSLDVGDAPVSVARNRAYVLERLGISGAVWLHAQHGAGVVSITGIDAGSPAADAMLTTSTGFALASLSADCVLVALADPVAGVIGTVHCGRLGLTAGVVQAAVAALHAHGATNILAALGPSVCGACYEVPQEMADEVSAVLPEAAARSREGRPALDVGAGVAAQLAAFGVEVRRRVGGCTREDPALYSYRRQHVTGRQAALIWRTP